MLPNLIIIGAMKCGTSSLHYYMGLHPGISMAKRKELNFFIRDRNWDKGIEWYKSHFTGKAKICGEATTNYAKYPLFGGVPERMYSVVPEMKLIYLVRDPIERILSHYVHNYADDRENRKLSDALIKLEANNYVRCSKYHMQLEQYLNYFPKSRILIIAQEDLYHHRRQTLQRVFRFLDVDDSFYSRKVYKIRNSSKDKRRKNRIGLLLKQIPGMIMIGRLPGGIGSHLGRWVYRPFSRRIQRPSLDERLRQDLIEHLKDDTNRLRELTGREFEGWCV